MPSHTQSEPRGQIRQDIRGPRFTGIYHATRALIHKGKVPEIMPMERTKERSFLKSLDYSHFRITYLCKDRFTHVKSDKNCPVLWFQIDKMIENFHKQLKINITK